MTILRGFQAGRSVAVRACSKRKPGSSLALGIAASLVVSHSISTSTPSFAESRSSTIFREASPVAYRRPSSQLVFLSKFEDRRHDWENWIGYFREAGYDCVDMNVATKERHPALEVLSEELSQQLRLLSLQRPPLLFAFHERGSEEALHQIQSNDPRMSGLVIVVPSADKTTLEALSNVNVDKLRIFVADESQGKDAVLRQVERWMTSQGLA